MEDSLRNLNKKNFIIRNIIVLVSILGFIVFGSIYMYDNLSYSVYVNNRFIGYSHSKREIRNKFDNIIEEINNTYEDVDLKKAKIRFDWVKKDQISITDESSVEKNIIKSLNGTVGANKLIIGNKEFGYISSDKEKNSIMNLLTESYLTEMKLTKEQVTSVNILGDIKLEKGKVNISALEPINIVSKRIYEANKDDSPILTINISIKDTVKEEIIPKTTIIPSSELYVGESKKEDGSTGEKEVLKEISYINGNKVDEKVLSEKVINEAKDSIIYKGNKDPIVNDVAFLNSPSRGSITSNYGPRWGKVHKGIDIAGNIGDPVKAALDGKVVEAYYSSSYGNVIVVDHGSGIKTLYAHCSKLLAEFGEEIKKGDVIAKVGNTGRSTGPHLHFELIVNGTSINPIKYID